VKFSTRAGTQFRLPMVEVVMNDVRSRAYLMLAMRPPDVVVAGETPVISERGVPALWITNIGIAGNSEEGKAAAAQVRPVGAWNSKNVRSDVGAEVGSLAVLAHARKADVAINNKSRRERQGVSHGHKLHERMEVAEPA